MYDSRRAIRTWLSAIHVSSTHHQAPLTDEQPFNRRGKRPLPSPPMSDDELSPSKRLCFDPEATPRKGSVAKLSEQPSLASESDWSSTTSSRPKRNRSGRASPTKGLAVLRIGHIINHHSLDGDKAPPQELDELVQILRQDAMGLGILTPSDMVRGGAQLTLAAISSVTRLTSTST